MVTGTILNKRRLITEHVGGLSFVDIGGLWGTDGETVSTAVKGGATRAVMADIQTPGGTWWIKLRERLTELGVEDYEELQVDICAPEAPRVLGNFDFVHCAGVMYHVPDLFRFVGNLVEVTNKYLLLSSVVMPDRIDSPSGSLVFGSDHAYLSPVLTDEHRQIVAEHLEEAGLHADGISSPHPYIHQGRPHFTPWWWLFSSSFMTRVVQLYGLEIVAEGATPKGRGYNVLARVPDPG
ncbi:MAG TPA: hypothetical protein VFY37_12655 [Solirubrobacterales bacterium]|nr:hypothetical protein [Solirubrobacterales bacterium]